MQFLASPASDDAVRTIADPEDTLTLTSYPSDPNHYRRVGYAVAEAIAPHQ